MRHSTRTAGAVASLLVALGVAGCSSATEDATSPSEGTTSEAPASESRSEQAPASQEPRGDRAQSETATITITDFAYDGPANVAPGTKITVTNDDAQAHTLTAEEDGGFDAVVPPGESVTFTAPAAGSYPYICIYHSNMSGTLEVA